MSVPGSTFVGLRHLYQGSKAENVCPRATENLPLSVRGLNRIMSSIGGVSLFNGIPQVLVITWQRVPYGSFCVKSTQKIPDPHGFG